MSFEKTKAGSIRKLVVLTTCVLMSTAAAHVVASTLTEGDETPTAQELVQVSLRDSIGLPIEALPLRPIVEATSATLDTSDELLNSLRSLPLLPFGIKKNGRVGSYRLGYWPAEKGRKLSAAYANPAGFIEVTPLNEQTRISSHFELEDFLTHDQQAVWPKYLVLRPQLIDKLELVIADLQSHGIPARNVQVMSGFRTPQYNQQGVGEGGRAQNSRHQYGDAADIFVDDNGDGRMDDLNRDGRSTKDDARVILQAVNRVEHAHPQLIGGAGLYSSTGAHGPFIHIDARGQRARWGGA